MNTTYPTTVLRTGSGYRQDIQEPRFRLEVTPTKRTLVNTAPIAKVHNPIIDVRLYKAGQPVMVVLGIIRVIPVEFPQRSIDLFESAYQINDRSPESFTKTISDWQMTSAEAITHLNEIWAMLRIVRSPIMNPSGLKQSLNEISKLEGLTGKHFNLCPIMPTPEETESIRARIKKRFDQSKLLANPDSNKNGNVPDPCSAKTLNETLVFAVCRVFNVSIRDFQSSRIDGKLFRARNIASYLLRKDLRARHSEVRYSTGQGDQLVLHGQNHIATLVKEKDPDVLTTIAEVRWIYRQAVDPTPELPFRSPAY